MYLRDLPADHPLRNTPLVGCWYQWTRGKDWRQVKPSFGIAGATYNDLGPAWTETSDFCWEPVGPNALAQGREPQRGEASPGAVGSADAGTENGQQ